MNPMVHLTLIGEKRLEIDQKRGGPYRFGQDEFLDAGWSRPRRRVSILAWLPRLRVNHRLSRIDSLPEAGC